MVHTDASKRTKRGMMRMETLLGTDITVATAGFTYVMVIKDDYKMKKSNDLGFRSSLIILSVLHFVDNRDRSTMAAGGSSPPLQG